MKETDKKNLKKDIEFIKEFINIPYPEYIHDIDLYDSIDYFGLACCYCFLKRPFSDISSISNIFAGGNLEKIEHNMVLIDSEELYNYYSKMRTAIRILKKYYNNDGTLKEKYKNAEIEKEKTGLIGKIKARIKHYRDFY